MELKRSEKSELQLHPNDIILWSDHSWSYLAEVVKYPVLLQQPHTRVGFKSPGYRAIMGMVNAR
jgi:hypothetical protein